MPTIYKYSLALAMSFALTTYGGGNESTPKTVEPVNVTRTVTIEHDDILKIEAYVSLKTQSKKLREKLQQEIFTLYGDRKDEGIEEYFSSNFTDIDFQGDGDLDVLYSYSTHEDLNLFIRFMGNNHIFINNQGKGFELQKLNVAATARNYSVADFNYLWNLIKTDNKKEAKIFYTLYLFN